MSTNLETVKALYKAFNERDWAGLETCFAQACMFNDGRGKELMSAGQVVQRWAKPWVEMSSDISLTLDGYHDAGESIVAEAVHKGTNDGFFGPLPGSGQPFELPVVHILHFNDEARVTFGRVYLDQMSLMQQLGYA
ncbi:MAG: nuclear transport factor 2 family protein [Actinomycetota bacterium]